MNPAAQKMLDNAMDRVHYALVEAENFRKRAGGFVKAFKAQIKATPDPQAERVLKAVSPIIPKLPSKSKAVDKGPNKKWTAPLMTVPALNVTLDSLTEFTRRWNDSKIAINRI